MLQITVLEYLHNLTDIILLDVLFVCGSSLLYIVLP